MHMKNAKIAAGTIVWSGRLEISMLIILGELSENEWNRCKVRSGWNCQNAIFTVMNIEHTYVNSVELVWSFQYDFVVPYI